MKPLFAQLAHHTLAAPKSLGYGKDLETLQKAWLAVGVTPSASAADTGIYNSAMMTHQFIFDSFRNKKQEISRPDVVVSIHVHSRSQAKAIIYSRKQPGLK